MKYIVYEYIGIETLYAIAADDEKELRAFKQLVLDEYPDRVRKIGEFISDHPLPHDWRYFACVIHGRETNPALRLVKKCNRNAEYML